MKQDPFRFGRDPVFCLALPKRRSSMAPFRKRELSAKQTEGFLRRRRGFLRRRTAECRPYGIIGRFAVVGGRQSAVPTASLEGLRSSADGRVPSLRRDWKVFRRWRDPYCLLRVPYCLLPIAYCLLPSAYCLVPSAYCLLPTAYCLLPTAYCLLPIAYCLVPSA